MKFNDSISAGQDARSKLSEMAREQIPTLPTDKEELIDAYTLRFTSSALEEFIYPEEISTLDKQEEFIRKYNLKEMAEQTRGDERKLAKLAIELSLDPNWSEDLIGTLIDYAEKKAIEFVCARRNRLRSKALLLMGEAELNERELNYLRFEGEFWYSGEEATEC